MKADARYDRQERIFGATGQTQLASTTVAVIGAGGVGSHVLQQLAYLGVLAIDLIDADRIEQSNLNRVVGAAIDDVGKYKVDVARRLLQIVNPHATIRAWPINFDQAVEQRVLAIPHFIIGCVDDDAARLSILQYASNNAISYLDIATGIADSGQVLGGRIFLSAGKGCLLCAGHLDQSEIRASSSTQAERDFQRTVYGITTDALEDSGPSVISLNGMIASLAVTEFLLAVTKHMQSARYVQFTRRSMHWTIDTTVSIDQPDCYYCQIFSASGTVPPKSHSVELGGQGREFTHNLHTS